MGNIARSCAMNLRVIRTHNISAIGAEVCILPRHPHLHIPVAATLRVSRVQAIRALRLPTKSLRYSHQSCPTNEDIPCMSAWHPGSTHYIYYILHTYGIMLNYSFLYVCVFNVFDAKANEQKCRFFLFKWLQKGGRSSVLIF